MVRKSQRLRIDAGGVELVRIKGIPPVEICDEYREAVSGLGRLRLSQLTGSQHPLGPLHLHLRGSSRRAAPRPLTPRIPAKPIRTAAPRPSSSPASSSPSR